MGTAMATVARGRRKCPLRSPHLTLDAFSDAAAISVTMDEMTVWQTLKWPCLPCQADGELRASGEHSH